MTTPAPDRRRRRTLRAAAPAALAVGILSLAACADATAPAADPTPTAAVSPSAPTASPTPSGAPSPASAAVWTLHTDPQPSPHCSGTGAGAPRAGVVHLYISIADQHLWECSGQNLVLDSAVTTGASAITDAHDATPTGTFRIAAKDRNTHLVGHDANGSWDDAVTYWLPFSGGVGLHDASWQTFPYGSDQYREYGSHGCVHVPLDAIAHIFGDVAVGTQVTIT